MFKCNYESKHKNCLIKLNYCFMLKDTKFLLMLINVNFSITKYLKMKLKIVERKRHSN